MEGAIKLARAYAGRGRKGKFEVVALDNSFHGRTIGALSATGQEKYRKDFEPLVPGFRFARFNDVKDLEAQVNENTCAVILEPIQGEGGIFEVSREFMEAAAKLARKFQAVLIFDEIQSGLGRTGDLSGLESLWGQAGHRGAREAFGGRPPAGRDSSPGRGGLEHDGGDARQHLRRRAAGSAAWRSNS